MLRDPADVRALGLCAAHFALLAALWQVPLGLLTPVAVGVMAFSAFVGANSAHNALHVPVFRSRPAERIWQGVLSLMFSYPSSAFVPAHNLSHHLHLQGPKDVLRTTEVRFGHNGLNLAVYAVRQGRHMLRTNLVYFLAMRTRSPGWFGQVIRELVGVLVFSAALAAIDWRRWLLLVFVPALLGLRAIVAYGYLQHDGCDAASEHDHSRNFTGRVWNWLILNNGYHGKHHDQPGLHWSKLPEAHARDVVPRQHPALDQPSILAWSFGAYVWPARRERFDGGPVVLPESTPDDYALPGPAEAPADVSFGAGLPR